MNYKTDSLISWLYDQAQQKRESLSDCENERLAELLTEKRAQFATALGLDKIAAMHHKPDFNVLSEKPMGEFTLQRAELYTLPQLGTPVYVIEPERYTDTVIFCHGHGAGALQALEVNSYQKSFPSLLAQNGYKVIMPELIGFGAVQLEHFKEKEQAGCYANTTQLMLLGLTMAGVRVNQILQLIDYCLKPNNGTKPILAGISGGGLVASFTGAVCPDIKGIFISCYANTFKGSIMAMHHCIDNFVPGILNIGEEPEMIALACPTPLLVSAGLDDPIFPIAQTKEALDVIRKIYNRFDAGGNIAEEFFDGEHEISTNEVFAWLKAIK